MIGWVIAATALVGAAYCARRLHLERRRWRAGHYFDRIIVTTDMGMREPRYYVRCSCGHETTGLSETTARDLWVLHRTQARAGIT